ncbi:MAG TPA: two-component regulator propeller domain-containing protein [Lacibacter sp.]|nr:two-component regulator propeller domain-containing protein [Lacibacter sp.]HMO88077.1 two-component regulator propeller domain-containing protein [Lacibacter sp.]HMP86463.1 two-component regulator propeller domain-containing protein [Lacibacter sp.]
MTRLLLFVYVLGGLLHGVQAQLPPVGQWRDHLEFRPATWVSVSADRIYAASRFGVFMVDRADGNVERYSKVNGLSDIGVRAMRYQESSGKLLIAYNNSNLDVLYRNDVINIPYIRRSNISGDKRINEIFFDADRAYLSTGLGVIVVNLTRYEISATWFLGNNGAQVRVNGFAADNQFFYAGTEEGLKAAPRSSTSLEDFRNWTLLSNANGLPNGPVNKVFVVGGKLFVQYFNSLYVRNGVNWDLVLNDGYNWVNVNAGDNTLLICGERNGWQERRITVVDAASGAVTRVIQSSPFTEFPYQATQRGNEIFLADFGKGLVRINGTSFTTIALNSPYGALDGDLLFHNNTLYVAGGSINEAWNYLFNGTGFFTFQNNTWTDYNRFTLPWMDTVFDIITVAVDPRDGRVYAGSFGGGLVEFRSPTNYTLYKQGSPVEVAVGDPNNHRVGGLAFDQENNLWFSNFGAVNNVGVKKADGSWKKFRVPFLIPFDMTGAILIDDFNQKWIQVPQGNGLVCFNHGSSIDNTGDDRWRWFRTGRGNGNLPGNFVNTMAKDKDGFIWLGTDKGIAIIQCPGEVFSSNGCEAFQPVVQQDNFAGLLFENEDVKAIAVDGANRKWVGTRNGVWLLSPDGDKVIQRFTAENSPLLSNEIIRIAIDPGTGEVFFSTFNGICSYRGTATEGKTVNETLLAFPNPVPPGYGGTIAIRGVASNSIVKITELNGRLVYQTRALGGQAVWNGRDYRGNRVASGVYLVLVSDETGQQKASTRIVFIK